MTAYRLAFELELHYGRGLLHARHQKLVAQARALRTEALGGGVRVSLAREAFERRARDALALFELRQAAVAKRDSKHGRDERGLAEARAHPGGVVVAPREGDARLFEQVVDNTVEPRPAGGP